MATGDYIIPGAQAVTETLSRVGGVINGCGQAALAVMQGIATGQPPSVAQVTALIMQGAQAGYTGTTGVSTPSGLAALGAASGTPLTVGSGQSALGTINANLARGYPTEVGVANARVFGGSDVNVRGHYITIVGRAASGNYIVADPNQPAALSGQFVQYSPAQITQAHPFGTLTPISINPPGNTALGSAAPLGGLFSAFGVSPQDFAWRSGLIVGGMILIVLGMLVFFSHQEGEAITTVVQTAPKAAAAAAA